LKITILGTGTSQGIPVIGCECKICQSPNPKDKRFRVSLLIETDHQKNILIDCSPDLRQQFLANNIRQVDAVLLTHEHNDHIIGMDDVRPFNFKQRMDMPIFATESVQKAVKSRFEYVFSENPYPGVPRLHLEDINPQKAFSIQDLDILPIQVMHGNLPVLGFRFGPFTYITDANEISSAEIEKAKGTEVLILNALHHREHYSHFNLVQALEMVEKIAPKKAYFTHVSHHMGLHKSVEATLPDNVAFAYDGQVFEF